MSIDGPPAGDIREPGPAPGPTPGPAPGPPAAAVATAERTSGGSAAEQGLIPVLTAPHGAATVIPLGRGEVRYILRPFEGVNKKQSPFEIGELQGVEVKNLLTDTGGLVKRGGSTDVTASGVAAVYGLHEMSALRELLLQACDDSTQWVASDAVNFTPSTETTIKQEGTASLKMVAAGAAADGDTIKHDFGAGATKDLSRFDAIEVLMRGALGAGDTLKFGISEDDITYTEIDHIQSAIPPASLTDFWRILRLDLTGMAATARDAIRFLRFRYGNSSGVTRTFYADAIRATKRVQHFLRARRTSGATATGGVRDTPGTGEFDIETNVSGAWVGLHSVPPTPLNTKVRMLDWLGRTYLAIGPAGMFKFDPGAGGIAGGLAVWNDPPPADLVEMHYEKIFLFGVRHDPHQLRHSDANSDSVFPTSTDPTGSDGGLFYVGRRSPYLPTAMKSAFGQLHLFTEGDLWILYGADNSNFSLLRSFPGAGTLSHESIVEFDRGMIWHDGMHNRILLVRPGGGPEDVGDPIRPELEAIPTNLKPWTAGAWGGGRYYLFSYADAGAVFNNRLLMLDLLTLRWHGPFQGEWVGFNIGLVGADGATYVGLSNSTAGGVRKVLTGLTDNGAAIAVTFKTGNLYGRLPHFVKQVRRFWVRTRNTSGAITFKFYRDLSGAALATYTLTPTGAATEILTGRATAAIRGEILQAELTESSTGALDIAEIGFDLQLVRVGR